MYCFSWIFIFLLVSSCSTKYTRTSNEVSELIGEAQVYLQSIEPAKEEFPTEFNAAKNKIFEARKHLQKGDQYNPDRAYEYSFKSIELSKKVMKDRVMEKDKRAKKVEDEIEEKPKESSLRSLLPNIRAMRKHVQGIASGKEKISVANYKIIEEIYEETVKLYDEGRVEKEITSEVSFGPGRYAIHDLLDIAKQELDVTVKEIQDSINPAAKKKTVRIDIYGHTDETSFTEGSRLIQELEKGKVPVPRSPADARRRALNMNLAYLRAETIGNYLKQRLQSMDRTLHVITKPIGKGEELPHGKMRFMSSASDDPTRRICIIESIVEAL
jgi:outer membrane protein OmpA-like peptidoglycan-associated protein